MEAIILGSYCTTQEIAWHYSTDISGGPFGFSLASAFPAAARSADLMLVRCLGTRGSSTSGARPLPATAEALVADAGPADGAVGQLEGRGSPASRNSVMVNPTW